MTAQPTCGSVVDPGVARAARSDHELLASAIERLPQFRHADVAVAPLPGGLTNRIYKLSAPDQTAVARLSYGKSTLLAIDRHAECHNAVAAAQAGAGPRVMLCEPDEGVAVVAWIEGRTYCPEDLDDSDTLVRLAAACRRLHQGPRFVNDFDMFAIQRYYLDVVEREGFGIPAGYLDFADSAQRIERALATRPSQTVPCHNDLLAANIMDDGERLWLIDYEYSGNNDACFELGNIWSESNLALGRLEELVDAYYEQHSPAKIARARLLAVMSKYGWTLWAAIQDAVSEVDFDFRSWGMEKYERAVEEFEGPEFSRLIEDVQQPT